MRAEPIQVSLDADHVLSPVIRYGDPYAAVFFPVEPMDDSHEATTFGRVTFEELDSIRCSRGEFFPYESYEYGSWVCELAPSAYLNERHTYESKHYETPLLDEYHHYIFSFHDEFIETIAKGFWIEAIGPKMTDEIPVDHPLNDLPSSIPAESFTLLGLRCELRRNTKPLDQLIEASKLCSQKLFQFFLILDGERTASYAARLRTVRGSSATHFQAGWPYPEGITVRGVAEVQDVISSWSEYVRGVADRRKEMGKKD
jgi:hypothetical protein